MRQRGFSLIELMLALTLGMLAVAAVGSVFIYGSRNYKQDDKVSRMQDELRFAMAQITQDIEMAGFFGQVRDLVNDITLAGDVANFPGAKDCGPSTDGAAATGNTNWVFQERRATIATHGNATAAQANAEFPCIVAAEFLAGTDILAIKRLGSPTRTQEDNKTYLRTNGVETTIHNGDITPGPTGAVCNPDDPSDDGTCIVTLYEYRPVVWFIRPWSVAATESPRIPALCRKVLQDGAMETDPSGCAASGIADLQLEFGFDTPDAEGRYDGLADYFREIGAPLPAAEMATVVAIRVHLLAQSMQRDVDYKAVKTFQLGTTVRGPFSDGYYHRALSSTVLLRNVMNRLSPYSLPSR